MPTPASATESVPVQVIEPGWMRRGYLTRMWRMRALVWALAAAEHRARYRQTYLGVGWMILQPLFTILIFSVVFHSFAKLPSVSNAPYALVVFAGLLPWTFFAQSLQLSANILVNNRELVTSVPFPRLALILEVLGLSLYNVVISLGVLVLGVLVFGTLPDLRLLALPLFIALAGLAALALGVWLAVLNAAHRDFEYLVPYLLQVGLFLSPVGFTSAIVPEAWRWLYALNPLVPAIDGCRWALFRGAVPLHLGELVVAVAVVLLLLSGGILFLRRAEATLADII